MSICMSCGTTHDCADAKRLLAGWREDEKRMRLAEAENAALRKQVEDLKKWAIDDSIANEELVRAWGQKAVDLQKQVDDLAKWGAAQRQPLFQIVESRKWCMSDRHRREALAALALPVPPAVEAVLKEKP